MWWYGRGNSGGSWPPAFPRSVDKVKKSRSNSKSFLSKIFPKMVKKIKFKLITLSRGTTDITDLRNAFDSIIF